MSTAKTTIVSPPSPARPQPPLHGPWPAYDLWARRWPVTGRPAGPPTVLAVAVAAFIGALALPLDRPGLGWLITTLAGVAALIAARAIPERVSSTVPPPMVIRSGPPASPDRFGWAAATIALLAVGTFRSALWLFVLCLLTAVLTGVLTLTGGRSVRGIVAGCSMPVIAVFRALPWLAGGAARLRRPAGGGPNVRIVATVAASIALLTVFGALFASADPAFADMLARLAPDLTAMTAFRWIFLFGALAAVLGGAAFLHANPPRLTELDNTEGRKVSRLEWAIPLGLLVLLFAAFVAVQLSNLFGGNGHVQGTDGLTYAQYARGGFWQLSFVTGLTLVVLAGAARWAPRGSTTDRLLIRVILGALAGLTLVIVGSALDRMSLYADTYGLTRLRLLVAACEAWFGLVLVLVLAAGLRLKASWLPRVAIAAGVAALLGLAAANPDSLIASYNIRQDRPVDLAYLSSLSPDAAPALTELDPAQRACVLGVLALRLDDAPDDWRGWNLGRERARTEIAKYLIDPAPYCS
jgi:hypothetical protein